MKKSSIRVHPFKKNKSAVSEIIGTALLLGVAVAFFSGLYVVVLSYPFEASPPSPTIVATIEGNYIIVEHRGGNNLGMNNKVTFDIGDGQITQTVGDILIDINGDGKWNIGEKLAYEFEYDLSKAKAEITGADLEENRLVITGYLNIFPECDIGIEISVDNKNPVVGDSVNITITVIHYRGDLNASGIEVKYLLPQGLEYEEHRPSTFDYNDISGIWHIIDELPMRGSVSITIQAKVLGDPIREPTQLAMILDGSGSINGDDWDLMKTGLSNAIENPDVFPHDGSVELTVIQFGGDRDWDFYWDDYDSDWDRSSSREHSGDYSARSDRNNKGYFICDDLDTEDASSININFWYCVDDTENDDLELYYYNGNSYDYIANLGDAPDEDTWLLYTQTITDSKYFISDFKIGFYSNLDRSGENVWIDDVLIETDSITLLDDGFETVSYSQVEINPIIITDSVGDPGYYEDTADDIGLIVQLEGYTPMGCGIRLAADQLCDLGDFDADKRQIVNLVTDGMPNCVWIPGTYTANHENYVEGKISAEEARTYLLDTLEMTEGQDEFDSLAVGVGGMYGAPDTDWLKDEIVWPQPGYIAPPYDQGPGWVNSIETWQEFEDAINEMFRVLFSSITSTVEIVGLDPIDPNPNNDQVSFTILPTEP